MTKYDFWRLIDYSRRDMDPACPNENQERQFNLLEEALALLPPSEICGYETIFNEYFMRTYRRDLWAVISIIEGGCSDDGFDYFRAWMISMGEAPFRAMEAAPDSLTDFADLPGGECMSFDDFMVCPRLVYKKITGEALPESCYTHRRPDKPIGEPWPADLAGFFQRTFPKTWKKRCKYTWPDKNT